MDSMRKAYWLGRMSAILKQVAPENDFARDIVADFEKEWNESHKGGEYDKSKTSSCCKD